MIPDLSELQQFAHLADTLGINDQSENSSVDNNHGDHESDDDDNIDKESQHSQTPRNLSKDNSIEDNPYSNNNLIKLKFYAASPIITDGFRIGVLSVIDTERRDYLSIEDRQNLLDLASAVSNLVSERRQRYLRFKKQRANLMLGLNHNLRTPVSDNIIIIFTYSLLIH